MRWNSLTKAVFVVLATAAGVSAAQAQTPPPPTTQPMSGAPEIRDGEQRFKVRGRFQYDVVANDWDNAAEQGTRSYVRRAFIGAQGRLTDQWRYKIDFVLNPGAAEATTATTTIADCDSVTPGNQPCVATVTTTGGGDDVAVDDAYLEYAGDFFSFVVGENNVTAPLEDRTSSLDIPFIERSSVINTFGYGRAAGLALLTTGANWTAAVGVYGDSLNNQDSNFNLDESTSISGRFTWTPIFENSPESYALLHLGVTARQRYAGDDASTRYRTRPLNGRGNRYIDAGSALLGQNDSTYGLELAGQWNQFGFTAEYHMLGGDTAAGTGFDYRGYYVDAFWSITGEPRVYRGNTGSFGAVVPRRAMEGGGIGHLMASARYDFIDLSDNAAAAATRGTQNSYAIGLDWIPLDHVRLKLNYALSQMDRTGPATTDIDAEVISLRTQFDF